MYGNEPKSKSALSGGQTGQSALASRELDRIADRLNGLHAALSCLDMRFGKVADRMLGAVPTKADGDEAAGPSYVVGQLDSVISAMNNAIESMVGSANRLEQL